MSDCLCIFREPVEAEEQRTERLTALPLTHLWEKLAQTGKSCGVLPTLFGCLTNPHLSQSERSFVSLPLTFWVTSGQGSRPRGKGTHNLVSVFWKNVGYRSNMLHFIFIVTYLCYKEGTYAVLKVMLFIHWNLPIIFVPYNTSLFLNIRHLGEKE